MRIETENAWLVMSDDVRPIGSPDACCYCKVKLGQQHKPCCVIRQRTVVIDVTFRLVRSVPEYWSTRQIEYGMNHARWCAINILSELDSLATHGKGCLCDFFTGRYVQEATAEDEDKYGVWIEKTKHEGDNG